MNIDTQERRSDAEVFYGATEAGPAGIAQSAASPANAADSPQPTEATTDALGERLSTESVLYGAGGVVPETPDGYASGLSSTFDSLEYAARYEQNHEDVQALAQGKQALMGTFHEFGVGDGLAGELTTTVAEYMRAPLSDERLIEQTDSVMRELQQEFGGETERMIAGAQRVAQEAMSRMPWLREYLEAGAGSDPKIIRAFAQIAKRLGK